MAARDTLLRRLTEVAAGDPRILALTLGGSVVVGETDEFSDVDVLLVCTDDGHESLLGEAPELAAGLGRLLASFTGEHVGEPRLLICLYGPPLLHVDLKFVKRADLDERVEDGVVLWEREPGLVEAACATPATWPTPDPQWIEDRFWVWVHYLAAKIGRGELFDCLDGLAWLRGLVFGPLLAVRHGRRPMGVRRLELYADDALPELERTVAGHTRESCLAAVHASIALYRRLREEAAVPGLVRREEAEAASVEYLAEIESAPAIARGEPG